MDAENPVPQESGPDVYEQGRERAKATLVACQKERGLAGCGACEKLLDCEIRNAYVDAVYLSMNKGQAGGFDF